MAVFDFNDLKMMEKSEIKMIKLEISNDFK